MEPSWPWPTCLSHLFILLERSLLCSVNPCDLFFPLPLFVSIQSSRALALPSRLCPTFSVFLLCSSAFCHSHPFHTSHLIIFAPFLCHSQAYPSPAPFPFPVPPKNHLHPLSVCSQLHSLPTSTHSFRQHCLPHRWLSRLTFIPPIFRLSRKAWSHQNRSTPSERDQPAQDPFP